MPIGDRPGKPKGSPKTGGRAKGTPNVSTTTVRDAIAKFAVLAAPKFWEWLEQVKDPAKKIELASRVIEYHIPKLSRSEVSGEDGGPIVVELAKFSEDPE